MKREVDILILLDLKAENFSSDPRVFRTAEFLADRGEKVAVIGFGDEEEEIILNENLSIFNVIPEEVVAFKSVLKLRKETAKKINSKFSYKLIIANDHVMLNLGVRLKRINRNVKLIYDSHEFFQDYQLEFFNNEGIIVKLKSRVWRYLEKRAERRDVKLVDELIASNQSIANEFEKIFKLKKRAHFLRNIPDFNKAYGTDELLVYDEKIFSLLEENKDFDNIIYFGNYMRKLNGFEHLLNAIKKLPENVKLIILGTDKSDGFFDEMITDLRISNRILKLNKVPHKLMPVIAKYAKISVVPTLHNDYLQCYLSLPNKFLESVKSCLPIVCVDLPEQKKIINEYKNGVLVSESGNKVSNQIEKGCLEILSNYNYYKKNAEECDKDFDVKNDLNELFNKILKE